MKNGAQISRVERDQVNKEMYDRFFSESKDHMPAETALVLHLHYRYGQPLKAISVIMGKSLSVIYNHHHRGLYLLEKELALKKIAPGY